MKHHVSRWMMCLLLIMVVGFGLLPTKPTSAAISISKTLINSTSDFVEGKFGLTGLTEGTGVQLISVGTLARWQTQTNVLCQPLSNMGFASYKSHIYAVGGLTNINNVTVATDEVCRTTVIANNGLTNQWLPDARPLPQPISRLAAVAVPYPNDATRGVLYAIGGRKNQTIRDGQLNTVYSAVINADGSLQAWQLQAATLPVPVENHTATAYTVKRSDNSTDTYIYVIGGFRQTAAVNVYPTVWRSKVGANGILGAWESGIAQGVPPLPIPASYIGADPVDCEGKIGLYNATAINFDAVTINGSRRMISVLGGVIQSITSSPDSCFPETAKASSKVFLGELDDNGNITWQNRDYNLPEPLSQTRALGAFNKIYTVSGLLGASQTDATRTSYSTYIDNDFSIATIGGQGNFVTNDESLALNDVRSAHGLVVVNYDNRSIVYMFGGTSSSIPRSDVMATFLGRDDDINSQRNAVYPNIGVYLSPEYALRGPGAITEMQWTAAVTNTDVQTDIQMQYRLANTSAELKTALWIDADADTASARYSVNGLNTARPTDSTLGRFVQFRALLTTNRPSERSATPVLKAPITIRYTVDGHPSMHIVSASFPIIQSGVTIEPSMVIRNDKPPTSTRNETVLDANIADPEGQYAGFFIDLYVFPPGVTATTPISDSNGAYPYNSAAYVELDKRGFTAGTQASIDPPLWKQNCGSSMCPPAQWSVIFNKPGTWTVVAVVDSGNNIPEADEVTGEWEGDNVYTFPVQSEVRGGTIHLPVMFKNGSP